MTPKEKALELVATYSRILPMNQTTLLDHKNCASVAVDEILDKDRYNNDYWKEVKQEIEKL